MKFHGLEVGTLINDGLNKILSIIYKKEFTHGNDNSAF